MDGSTGLDWDDSCQAEPPNVAPPEYPFWEPLLPWKPRAGACLATAAVAYRSEGPISSTVSLNTVRLVPSFAWNVSCESVPLAMTPCPWPGSG